MIVTWTDRGVRIEARGAEVDALYRAYLKSFGAYDGATQDVFAAVMARQDYVDEIPTSDADPTAGALRDAGMELAASQVEGRAIYSRGVHLQDQAAQLEAEGAGLIHRALTPFASRDFNAWRA